MGLIPVTQFLFPNGEQRQEHYHPLTQAAFDKAMAIIDHGFRFEAELLKGVGPVSFTISDKDMDYANVIYENVATGDGLIAAIDKLVMDFNVDTPHYADNADD